MAYYFDSCQHYLVCHHLNIVQVNCQIYTRLISSPFGNIEFNYGYNQLREKPMKVHRLKLVDVNMFLSNTSRIYKFSKGALELLVQLVCKSYTYIYI